MNLAGVAVVVDGAGVGVAVLGGAVVGVAVVGGAVEGSVLVLPGGRVCHAHKLATYHDRVRRYIRVYNKNRRKIMQETERKLGRVGRVVKRGHY